MKVLGFVRLLWEQQWRHGKKMLASRRELGTGDSDLRSTCMGTAARNPEAATYREWNRLCMCQEWEGDCE